MRENRTCGSEGGEAQSLPYPYRLTQAPLLWVAWLPRGRALTRSLFTRWARHPRSRETEPVLWWMP